MEIRHLKYFIAVAEELSFTKAARRLNISQPPLSKQIKDLEDSLQHKLFIRSNKEVKLTEVGAGFLFKAYRIIKEIEETKQHLQEIYNNDRKEISVGFSETALQDLISIMKLFKKHFSDIDIKLHRLSSPEQIPAIKNNEIDIGFICSEAEEEMCKTEVLNSHSFNIVLPKEHPLSSYNSPIPINKLKDETFILTPRNVSPSYYDAAFSTFHSNNFFPTKTITAHSSIAIIALIGSGLGVALMPSSLEDFFSNNEEISFKRIKKSVDIKTHFMWNPHNTSPEIKKLIKLSKEYQKSNLNFN